MRKRLITSIPQGASPSLNEDWLDLDGIALVEVTSEEKDYTVEAALIPAETRGWRAADSGTQTIRLIFDEPQRLKRVALVFEETERERTQELVLRWSPDGGRSFRDAWLEEVEWAESNSCKQERETRQKLPWDTPC